MFTPKDFPPPPEDKDLEWCQFGLPGPDTLRLRDEIRKVLKKHSEDFSSCHVAVDAGCNVILVTLYPRRGITETVVKRLNAILEPFKRATDRIELYQDDAKP